jgi:ParB-like chromosome segregation protein Spo0J
LHDESGTNQAKSYGKVVTITLQDIVNDDLGAFLRFPQMFGAMAARKREILFFTALLANGSSFFASGNSNYYTGGATALSATSLKNAVNYLAAQKGIVVPPATVGEVLNLQPRYLLTPNAIRFTAAELAGMQEIPCSVVDVDDAGAVEICVTENLQRESLNPIEEANGVARLLGLGMSHAQAAAKIGKSERWVWRRVSLQNLIPRIKVEVERGTRGLPEEIEDYEVPAWFCAPAAALEVVARLPHGIQDEVFDKYTIGMTIDDLRETCDARMRDLANAEWARDGRSPQAKACAKCAKRTDAQAMLFDDMADTGARCLDGECWQRQTAAWKVAHPPQTPTGTADGGSADEDDGDAVAAVPTGRDVVYEAHGVRVVIRADGAFLVDSRAAGALRVQGSGSGVRITASGATVDVGAGGKEVKGLSNRRAAEAEMIRNEA